jgi:hypothetical protein
MDRLIGFLLRRAAAGNRDGGARRVGFEFSGGKNCLLPPACLSATVVPENWDAVSF